MRDPSSMQCQREVWLGEEAHTSSDLRCSRSVVLYIEVRNVLPQQALQEGFSQRVCCSGCCNTYAQCCHIANDETANEQVDEVEDKMVHIVLKLSRVALAGGIIVERAC